MTPKIRTLVVLEFAIPEDRIEDIAAILDQIDLPRLRHFTGQARIAVDDVDQNAASSVIAYLDGGDEL